MAKQQHTKSAPQNAEKQTAEKQTAEPQLAPEKAPKPKESTFSRNDLGMAFLCALVTGNAHNVSENAADNKTLVRKAFALADAFLA